MGIIFVLLNLSLILAQLCAAVTTVISADDTHHKTLQTITERSWSRILPYLGVSLLAGLVVFGGLTLIIIPGIIAAIWLAFSTVINILEKEKIVASLLRSRELVRNYWWPVLGRFVVLFLAIFVFMGLLNAILTGIFQLHEEGLPLLFINQLANILIFPFATIYMVSLYKDLKKQQKEISLPKKSNWIWWFFALGILGFATWLSIPFFVGTVL